MADRMKQCVSCLIYLHQHFFLVLMYCLKNDQECIINFLELIYLDLVLFWSKNLKPLLAAESRSVLLGEAGALRDVFSFVVVVIYAMVLFS